MAKRVTNLPNNKSSIRAQNETEVHNIMKERGYYSLFDDEPTPPEHSHTKKWIIITCIMLPVGVLAYPTTRTILLDHENKVHDNLISCLSEIDHLDVNELPEDGTAEDTLKLTSIKLSEAKAKLECHDQNKTKDYEAEVAKIEEEINISNLYSCLANAEINYFTSEEEIDKAANDTQFAIVILKRWDSLYSAKISCYKNYHGTSDFQSKISELQAKRSENQSYIDMAENSLKTQTNQNYYYSSPSYNPIHCYTNQIGSSSYTNCY
ncbi:hypothetical protein IJG21_02820 [Candidatus Saccharibacteria bacterium]|nr:hypothetical protein [Candidatus Saccharibacteria bacterium]MBQ6461199.1 hypothetical protein [Candidatus Saccharibacteria bacterium]